MKFSIKKDERGFTLVELMVGTVLLAFVFMIGFSFFIYYGRTAAGAYKKSAGHESAGMALKLLQRDLAQAGNALCPDEGFGAELTVLATNDANLNDGFYHELYVNFAGYLNPHYSAVPNVFTTSGFLRTGQVPGGQFVINAQSDLERQFNLANIGYAIVAADPFMGGGAMAKLVEGMIGGVGSFPAAFRLVNTAGLPGNYRLAPAIGYKVERINDPVNGVQYGVLRRYGQNIVNGNNVGQAVLGGDMPDPVAGQAVQPPSLTVERDTNGVPVPEAGFSIRCLFVDADGVTLRWAPTERPFNALQPANLRYVEVTLTYKTLEQTAGRGASMAAVTAVKTMRVSPRITLLYKKGTS